MSGRLSKSSARHNSEFDIEYKLVTSYFLSPVALGAIRILFGVYTFITTLTTLIRTTDGYVNLKSTHDIYCMKL